MIIKSEKTNQFKIVNGPETIGDIIYATGTYNSHNMEDPWPPKAEFCVRCENIELRANDLNEALQLWINNGAPSVVSITTLG